MPPGDLNAFHCLAPYLGESATAGGGGQVFRCPSHPWLPKGNERTCCSYALNLSLNEAENEKYSPFSTRRNARFYFSSPADTILAVEMWMRPNAGGTFPNELRLDDPEWSPLKAGVAPLTSYEAATGARFDEGGRLLDPGPYRFLDCYKGTDTPVSRMYHRGRINVLFVDGHVESMDLRELASASPAQSPMWTALLD
jgi:prepilin-type processing-associated H-X9-DG protein